MNSEKPTNVNIHTCIIRRRLRGCSAVDGWCRGINCIITRTSAGQVSQAAIESCGGRGRLNLNLRFNGHPVRCGVVVLAVYRCRMVVSLLHT